jgi:hypothetical protein
MKGFGKAIVFISKRNILALTRWKSPDFAQQFMQIEKEILELNDKRYKEHLKEVTYTQIEIKAAEKALVARKVVQLPELEEKKRKKYYTITTFVTVRRNYMLEGIFVDKAYKDEELKDMMGRIWETIQVK